MNDDMDIGKDHPPQDTVGTNNPPFDDPENAYEPWMLVSRRRGRGDDLGGASGSGRPGSRAAHAL